MEKSARFGSPLELRTNGAKVIDLFHAIVDLDGDLGLGWRTVKGYDERLEGSRERLEEKKKMDEMSRKMDDMSRNLIETLQFSKLLVQQIDDLRGEVNAGRVRQENGVCPRVFFIVPIDKSKLQKVADFNLSTKKMQLYFMCSMFLEKLCVGLQTKTGNNTLLDPAAIKALCSKGEFSEPLEIELSRDFVKNWGPAVKLSLKVVNVLVHAAAFGFGAGTLIPNLSLSENEKLFDVLREDLETVERRRKALGWQNKTPRALDLLPPRVRWCLVALVMRPCKDISRLAIYSIGRPKLRLT